MSSSNSTTNTPWQGDSISLENVVQTELITKNLNVAFLACTVWEMTITVNQGYEVFWKHRWTLSKFMFYFNQIDSIFIMTADVLQIVMSSPSIRFCTSFLWSSLVATSFLIAVINYTLLSRVYALWNLSQRILIVCLCAFSLNIGSFVGLFAYTFATSHATATAQPFTGCSSSPSPFKCAYVAFIVSIVFETVVIFLIVIKSYPIVRLRGVHAPLFFLLFEDGLLFYCAMLISQILTLSAWLSLSPVTLPMLGSSLPLCVSGVACNRLLLRSQQLLQDRGTDFSSSSTSRGVANAADITIEFRNQEVSDLTDYSTGEGLELASMRKDKIV